MECDEASRREVMKLLGEKGGNYLVERKQAFFITVLRTVIQLSGVKGASSPAGRESHVKIVISKILYYMILKPFGHCEESNPARIGYSWWDIFCRLSERKILLKD